MVAAKMRRFVDQNQNTLVWPTFESYDGFTSPLPETTDQVLSGAGQQRWVSMLRMFNTTPVPQESPNDDILGGRLKKFVSMSDLIADLDTSE